MIRVILIFASILASSFIVWFLFIKNTPKVAKRSCWESGYAAGYEAGRNHIPSPRELQNLVGVKSDGVFGDETMKAWKDAYNNQCALPYFDVNVPEVKR